MPLGARNVYVFGDLYSNAFSGKEVCSALDLANLNIHKALSLLAYLLLLQFARSR